MSKRRDLEEKLVDAVAMRDIGGIRRLIQQKGVDVDCRDVLVCTLLICVESRI